MFTGLKQLPDDPILRLGGLFKLDERETKVDVGVGVFQDEHGNTPIMRAVKAAEKQLWAQEDTKTYLGLAGNVAFNDVMKQLVLGDAIDHARVGAIQSVAGTGGLRLLADVIADISPESSVWIPNLTWGNHVAIFSAPGLTLKKYSYFNEQTQAVDESALLESLNQCKPKDVVVLHGCCHNPTGADLSAQQWHKVAEVIREKALVPIIDLAYLGFGQGLEQDAYGLRHLAKTLDNVWIVVSCSKNFGLYRERTGVVLSVAANAELAAIQQSYMAIASRAMVSLPPNHGAGIVNIILRNPELKATWAQELAEMASYIHKRREQFAQALQEATQQDWSFITKQQGMFSVLPLGEALVETLREDYGVYLVGQGRINFAGLRSEDSVQHVARSIAKVIG